MSKKAIEKIENSISDLIAEMGIEAKVKAEIIKTEEKEDLLQIQIDSEQAASLIGFHGETLHSLQIVSSYIAHKFLEKWTKVAVNIGDYLQKREEQLQKLALNLAMKAKFSQEQQIIPNLTAAERRIIHLALADRPDVVTQSEGEGKLRQLTIKPKSQQ